MSSTDTSEEFETGLRSVISRLADGFAAEDAQAVETVSSLPPSRAARDALKRSDLPAFRAALQYPVDRILDGILAEAFPKSPKARYLVRRADYVTRHFRRVIQQAEGLACCADKTREIVRALLAHFATGEAIAWDRGGTSTFHLPTKVFLDQQSVVEFFEAIQALDYGDPTAYLARPELSVRLS